jgi:hypothetical protein
MLGLIVALAEQDEPRGGQAREQRLRGHDTRRCHVPDAIRERVILPERGRGRRAGARGGGGEHHDGEERAHSHAVSIPPS